MAAVACVLLGGLPLRAQPSDPALPRRLSGPVLADVFDPQFPQCDGSYQAITVASDARVYFGLCSHDIDTSARLYRFDPRDESLALLGDLDAVLNLPQGAVKQGKIHTPVIEHEGSLYFATHSSIYRDALPDSTPAAGRRLYPGGHLVAYDLTTGTFRSLASAPPAEGFITLTLSPARGLLVALTWPSGLLFTYRLADGQFQCLGAVQQRGEWDPDQDQRQTICRTLAAGPDGRVFGSDRFGGIWELDVTRTRPVRWLALNLRDTWPATTPTPQSHHWRTIDWNPVASRFVVTLWHSVGVVEFDPPPAGQIDGGSLQARASLAPQGAFRGATLATATDIRGRFFNLANYPAPVIPHRPDTQGASHLLSYDPATGAATDHGPVLAREGRWRLVGCESLAVAPDGAFYAVGPLEQPADDGKPRHGYRLLRFGLPPQDIP
jgi:hypothetical protein